jgi:hypothetical protein
MYGDLTAGVHQTLLLFFYPTIQLSKIGSNNRTSRNCNRGLRLDAAIAPKNSELKAQGILLSAFTFQLLAQSWWR